MSRHIGDWSNKYICVKTLLDYSESTRDHSIDANDFMRMQMLDLNDLKPDSEAIEACKPLRVSDILPQSEILAQYAEECIEAAHAALKLRRALIRANPTPVSAKEARDALEEEMADVKVCEAEIDGIRAERIEEIKSEKSKRWISRLTESQSLTK